MEITNEDLLALRKILPPVIAAIPLANQKLRYRLNKNLGRVNVELVDKDHGFDQAERDLVDIHTQKDDDGNPVHPMMDVTEGDGNAAVSTKVPDKTRVLLTDTSAFVDARNELLSATVDVYLMTIPVSWFEGIDAPTDDLFRYCGFLLVDDSE